MRIFDADDNVDGDQVSLAKGANTINVEVTAEDEVTTGTYTVVVTRTVEIWVPLSWSLVPSGLDTGDTFRLLFLSSTKRLGSSTNIAVYNTFIQERAAAGHADIQAYSAGFKAVGCTADTDARDNTGTRYTASCEGAPIYWLGGAKVADDYEDFYDGSWDEEANDKNESGANGPDTSQVDNYPFTGCDHDGTEAFASGVVRALGGTAPRVGRPNSSGADDGPLGSASSATSSTTRPFYGLSEVFQVTDVLVSNFDGTSSGIGALNVNDQAQAFTTGSDANGYTLTSIEVGISGSGDIDGVVSVSIRSDNSGAPGASQGTLGSPTEPSEHVWQFSTTGIDLSASTTYFVVFDVTGTTARHLINTASDSETAILGWTIADGSLFRAKDTTGAWTSYVQSKRMQLKGTVHPPATLSDLAGAGGRGRQYDRPDPDV